MTQVSPGAGSAHRKERIPRHAAQEDIITSLARASSKPMYSDFRSAGNGGDQSLLMGGVRIRSVGTSGCGCHERGAQPDLLALGHQLRERIRRVA